MYKEVMQAIVMALDEPRDRLGRLKPVSHVHSEQLRKLAVELKVGGCSDLIEQSVKVIKATLAKEL